MEEEAINVLEKTALFSGQVHRGSQMQTLDKRMHTTSINSHLVVTPDVS